MIFHSLYSLLVIFSAIASLSNAQQNVTVNSTSTLIQYGGNAGEASLCLLLPDGKIRPDQPGCYNAPSHCTETVVIGQGGTGTASFSFHGSAIYINSLLDSLSPIYTVTLDGVPTDVDGVRASAPFICSFLFSKTGLDPDVEHRVQLGVKGPSPTRNQTFPDSENDYVFSLVSFIYTATNSSGTAPTGGSSTSASLTRTTSTRTTASGSTNSPATTSSSSGAEISRLHGLLALGTVMTIGWSILML